MLILRRECREICKGTSRGEKDLEVLHEVKNSRDDWAILLKASCIAWGGRSRLYGSKVLQSYREDEPTSHPSAQALNLHPSEVLQTKEPQGNTVHLSFVQP